LIPQFIISFREAFEVVLLIVVIIGVLNKLGMLNRRRDVLLGVSAAIAASMGIGLLVYMFYNVTSLKTLFEITGAYLAVAVLTYVVYHMGRSANHMVSELKQKVSHNIYSPIGLFIIGFIITIREGIEVVLFMIPFMTQSPLSDTIIGLSAGIFTALTLALVIYFLEIRLPIRKMFISTSILIIFIASGVLGYAVHETLEYLDEIGYDASLASTYIYNLNISSEHPMSEANVLGGLLSALIGYSTKMEVARAVIQLGYLFTALYLYLRWVVWTRG